MRLLLIVLLLLLLIGALPVWPYAAGWGLGYFPSGLLGLVLLIILIAALTGGAPAP
jgi:uncharacterized protein DUF3309